METWLLIVLGLLLATLVLMLVAAVYIWWRIYTSDEKRFARRVSKLSFGDKLALGWAVFKDPRVAAISRVIAVALVLYLASPLDLLPDFIPVIGYLDDVLIVMVGAGLLLRTVPDYVLEEHLARFERRRHEEAQRLETPQPR